MIEQTQFPFQQQVNSKSPLIAIIFTAIVVFILLSIIRQFKNSETRVADLERLNAS